MHISGANGQTVYGTKSVLIRADMDDAAMVKTLIHDLLTAPVAVVSLVFPSTSSVIGPGPVGSPDEEETDGDGQAA
jgi:hypothetical protein